MSYQLHVRSTVHLVPLVTHVNPGGIGLPTLCSLLLLLKLDFTEGTEPQSIVLWPATSRTNFKMIMSSISSQPWMHIKIICGALKMYTCLCFNLRCLDFSLKYPISTIWSGLNNHVVVWELWSYLTVMRTMILLDCKISSAHLLCLNDILPVLGHLQGTRALD